MDEALLMRYIPAATAEQRAQFLHYYALLVDWNTRINLTAITAPEEVAAKHFADSLLPMDRIPMGASLIDLGTGAGFPGLPLRIMRPDLRVTLLDSLQKRVGFLQAVCEALGLTDVECLHARAEDAAHAALRARFDVATARAVAQVRILCEWTLPFLQVGGLALLYKGPQAEAELYEANRVLTLLHGEAKIQHFAVPWGERAVVTVKKIAPTPKAYPRKAGMAAKAPL